MVDMRRLLRMRRGHGDGRVGGIRDGGVCYRRWHGGLDGLTGSSPFARIRRRGRDVEGSEGIDGVGHVVETGRISCNCKLRRRRRHWRRFDVALR